MDVHIICKCTYACVQRCLTYSFIAGLKESLLISIQTLPISSVYNLTLPPINDGLIKQMYDHTMKFYVVIYKVASSKKKKKKSLLQLSTWLLGNRGSKNEK